MHCRQAEARIQSLLDERAPLASDRALGEHLADCGECRRLAALYERILAAFAEPYSALPSRRERIAPLPRRSAWLRRPLPAGLAAAAAALLVWLSAGPRADVPPREVVQDSAHLRPSAPQVEGASGAVLTIAPAPPGVATPDALAFGAVLPNGLLLQAPWDAALPHGFDRLSPLAFPWVQPVAGGFKPVTRSVEAAWGALRNTMLGPEPAARS
jgi:hypothetical protein